MAYCGPRGIPHSEFLAWPVDDQAKALGWMGEEAHKCSQCGTADWEREENADGFSAEPYVCIVCARVENTRTSLSKNGQSAPPGIHVRVVRNGGTDGEP